MKAVRPTALLMVALLIAAITACGDLIRPGPGSTITADTFVEVMVQLRLSPELLPSGYLPPGEPERILAENGVTAEEMRRFVEVHGQDVPFMRDVWTRVDDRLRAEQDEAEAAGSDEPATESES